MILSPSNASVETNEDVSFRLSDPSQPQLTASFQLSLRFESSPLFSVQSCSDDIEFSLPSTQNDTRVWTFVKDGPVIQVFVDGEVVITHIADSSNTDCLTQWMGTALAVEFLPEDTATLGYRDIGSYIPLSPLFIFPSPTRLVPRSPALARCFL